MLTVVFDQRRQFLQEAELALADVEMRIRYAELVSESQRRDAWWRNYIELVEQRTRLKREVAVNRKADVRDIEDINADLQMYCSQIAAYKERRPGSALPPRLRGFYAD